MRTAGRRTALPGSLAGSAPVRDARLVEMIDIES